MDTNELSPQWKAVMQSIQTAQIIDFLDQQSDKNDFNILKKINKVITKNNELISEINVELSIFILISTSFNILEDVYRKIKDNNILNLGEQRTLFSDVLPLLLKLSLDLRFDEEISIPEEQIKESYDRTFNLICVKNLYKLNNDDTCPVSSCLQDNGPKETAYFAISRMKVDKYGERSAQIKIKEAIEARGQHNFLSYFSYLAKKEIPVLKVKELVK